MSSGTLLHLNASTLALLNLYLSYLEKFIYLKGKEIRSTDHWFPPQWLQEPGGGLAETIDQELYSGLPPWVAGTQAFGPSSAAFQCISWTGCKAARTGTCTLYASVTRHYLTHSP